MGRRYKEPPIIEAACEFRFDPSVEWDLAIPGLIYPKIHDRFPKLRQIKEFEISGSAGPRGIMQRVIPQDRLQFLSPDEKDIIQVGSHLLLVSRVAPYPSWKEFKPAITTVLERYREAANPKGFHRIGLRYINRVDLPGDKANLEEFFDFYPYLGERLPQEHGPFFMAVQMPYVEWRDVLRLQMSSDKTDEGSVAILLDLDYFLGRPGEVGFSAASEWLDEAHSRIEDVFEGCIKDRLRTLFTEVE